MLDTQLNVEEFVSSVEEEIFRLAPELEEGLPITLNQGLPGPIDDPRLNSQRSTRKRFVMALSGGSDSTALLTAMSRICETHSWQLHAAHINHMTRGQESVRDEAFCRNLGAKLNINL